MFRGQLFMAVKEPWTYFLFWMISRKQQPIYVTLFHWSLYKLKIIMQFHGLAYICHIYHCVTGVEPTTDRSRYRLEFHLGQLLEAITYLQIITEILH